MFLFLIPGRSAAALPTLNSGRTELNRYQFSVPDFTAAQTFAPIFAIQDEVASQDGVTVLLLKPNLALLLHSDRFISKRQGRQGQLPYRRGARSAEPGSCSLPAVRSAELSPFPINDCGYHVPTSHVEARQPHGKQTNKTLTPPALTVSQYQEVPV
jgi:hypothetical protein